MTFLSNEIDGRPCFNEIRLFNYQATKMKKSSFEEVGNMVGTPALGIRGLRMGALTLPVPPIPKLVMGVGRRPPPFDDSYFQGVGSQGRKAAQRANTLAKLWVAKGERQNLSLTCVPFLQLPFLELQPFVCLLPQICFRRSMHCYFWHHTETSFLLAKKYTGELERAQRCNACELCSVGVYIELPSIIEHSIIRLTLSQPLWLLNLEKLFTNPTYSNCKVTKALSCIWEAC